jgi:DICT domain-containing protein
MDAASPLSSDLPRPHAGLAPLSLTAGIDAASMRLHSRKTMIALSHLIEEHAAAGLETILIAAFQRFSLYRPELARYHDLAQQLRQIYVIGVQDVVLPTLPNISTLAVEPAWPLVNEWAVIASGPTCCAALLARDAEGYRPDKRSRAYHGIWTTDAAIVDRVVAAFHGALGLPLPNFARDPRATLRNTTEIQRALAARLREVSRAAR